MNPITTNQPPVPSSQEPSDIAYVYMPKINRIPDPPKVSSLAQQTEVPAVPRPARHINKKLVYIITGVVLLVALIAFGASTFLKKKDNTTQPPPPPPASATKLPQVWLKQYFNVDVCLEPTKCSDQADPDNDGLSNYNEFKYGANPTKADTDGDGLADGDEINIYKTEPDLKYTDRREVAVSGDYNDGHSFKNGYDPLTPGLRLTESRKKQIADDTAKFGLHEPTKTTLKEDSMPQAKTYTVFIQDNKIDPSPAKINVGDTVVWLNKDKTVHMIASDPHPQHTNLPSLVSPKLSESQTFSLKFDAAGIFTYHDHLMPTIKGSVEVIAVDVSNPSP